MHVIEDVYTYAQNDFSVAYSSVDFRGAQNNFIHTEVKSFNTTAKPNWLNHFKELLLLCFSNKNSLQNVSNGSIGIS